jgi:maltose/moltooligosaccharide transporter
MGAKKPAKEFTEKDKWSTGTLTYTKFGLFTLFAWLLWGDFCYHLMEKVMHSVLPLQLQSIGANNKTLAIMVTILPNILGFSVGPAVSYKSDRYRSKWGRRIPFMAATAPFLCFFLVGVGYTEDIAVYLRDAAWLKSAGISPFAATMTIIGFLVLGFAFFNEFVGSVYWYLFADVVPHARLGTFMGCFRIVGSAANIVYQLFVFPHAETHAKYIYIGGALLYFFGFGLMCWRVKEGQYPDEEPEEHVPKLSEKIRTYLRECFCHPIYRNYYMFHAVWTIGSAGTYGVFFAKQIGVSLTQMGIMNAIMNAIHMVVTLPAGMIADKFHPMRLTMFITFLSIPGAFLAYWFKVDWPSYVLLALLLFPVHELASAVHFPLHVRILPKKRYGQFASANGMLKQGGKMLGAIAVGACLDYFQDYRFYLLWAGIFHILALFFLLRTYYFWKQCGGDNYVAPLGKKTLVEVVTHHEVKGEGSTEKANS